MLSVSELVTRMWEVLHTPALYQNLYCAPTLTYRTATIYAHGPLVNAQGVDCNLVTITGVKLKTQRGPSPIDRENAGCLHSPSDTSAEEVVLTSEGVIYTMFANGTGTSTSSSSSSAKEDEGAINVEFGGRVEVVDEMQARFLGVELGGSLELLLLPFRVLSTE
ncbi:hypothetical protein Gpo141_00006741 [Globisporangium polare]